MGVVDDAFKEATKSLDLATKRDRLVAGYVRRRAEQLHKLKPSADGLDLAVNLMAERANIMSFITERMLSYMKDKDEKMPKHLDLAVMSKVTVSSDSTKGALAKTYVINRAEWIWQIVWRAMMIHSDLLWKSTTPPRELATEALDEILDRRLRTVEQLHCHVNSGGVALSNSSPERKWKVDGPGGPWTDGVIVRNFEYPFLPKAPFKDHLTKMTNWKPLGPDTIIFSPSGDITGPKAQANIRFPKRVTKAWLVLFTSDTSTRWPTFQPNEGLKHDDVFRDMFDPPRENFFDRNWLYCDQTGSAVNIEALEFGMKRRPGAPHTNFEKAMTTENYVRLGPVVRTHREQNAGILMSDDNDEFFENTFVDLNDVQVGDFVCFWNNHLYDLVASGAWRNEYSHIMDVDTDVDGHVTTTSLGPKISLSGHGLTTTLYSAMATDMIKYVEQMLDDLRTRLRAAVTANTTPPTTRDGQTLVQWSPYENFDAPGAWWIKIPKDVWNKQWIYQSLDDAVKAVPRTVAKEAGGTGYNAPPDADAIYFPLFEPNVSQTGGDGDSWRAYLNKRKADAKFRAPTKLNDLTVDGRLAQGLYYHGSAKTTIPVVRPKVRK